MLHNLIGNEEEELSYRENEVEMLSEEIKKLCKEYPIKEIAKSSLEGLLKSIGCITLIL